MTTNLSRSSASAENSDASRLIGSICGRLLQSGTTLNPVREHCLLHASPDHQDKGRRTQRRKQRPLSESARPTAPCLVLVGGPLCLQVHNPRHVRATRSTDESMDIAEPRKRHRRRHGDHNVGVEAARHGREHQPPGEHQPAEKSRPRTSDARNLNPLDRLVRKRRRFTFPTEHMHFVAGRRQILREFANAFGDRSGRGPVGRIGDQNPHATAGFTRLAPSR
jgi:hypothetical protein